MLKGEIMLRKKGFFYIYLTVVAIGPLINQIVHFLGKLFYAILVYFNCDTLIWRHNLSLSFVSLFY